MIEERFDRKPHSAPFRIPSWYSRGERVIRRTVDLKRLMVDPDNRCQMASPSPKANFIPTSANSKQASRKATRPVSMSNPRRKP